MAQQGLPEDRTEDSDEGDRIHAWLAWHLQGRIGDEPELSEEEMETAQRCLRQYDVLRGDMIGGLLVEQRFWLSRPLHDGSREKMFSGKFDVVAVAKSEALIVDWKTGRIAVPHARDNMQLLAGAVLLKAHYPQLDHIRVAIVQPWCSGKPSVAEYDLGYLREARARLVAHVRTVMQPGQPRIPGESQCRYCLAKGTNRCPESMQAVERVATLALPDGRAGELADGPQMARWLDACATATKIIESVRRRALHMAQAGVEIPGYQIEPGAEKREVSDSAGAYAILSSTITAEAFAACAKVGITKLGDAFAKAKQAEAAAADKKRPTKKALLEELDGILAPFITTKQNAPSLVRTTP